MRFPRYLPERSLVETTIRTTQSQFLLVPREDVNQTIIGIVARAQLRYQVPVIELKPMSTHLSILATYNDADQMAAFQRYVNSNVALKISRIRRRTGPFWERRYTPIIVTNEEVAQVARLRYSLANGAKEGLVAGPCHWPGATGVNAMLDGSMCLKGIWLDQSRLSRARYVAKIRGEPPPSEKDFCVEEILELSRLPCWEHLSPEEYSEAVRGLVEEIEAETSKMHEEKGTQPLGSRAVCKQRVSKRAQNPAKSPRPIVHASSVDERQRFREGRRLFVDAYYLAANLMKEGKKDFEFPPGSFPPRLPFVPLRAPPSA